jgi:hypothetical protein
MIAVALILQIADGSAAQTVPPSGGPVDPAIIEDLVAANRILAGQGVVDAYGHVSIRHPANPNRYLMSRSLAPILVTAQDIVEYESVGNLTSVLSHRRACAPGRAQLGTEAFVGAPQRKKGKAHGLEGRAEQQRLLPAPQVREQSGRYFAAEDPEREHGPAAP